MSNATDTRAKPSVSTEQREAWRADAEAHAADTRHPSGYYPSARILALLDALDEATA